MARTESIEALGVSSRTVRSGSGDMSGIGSIASRRNRVRSTIRNPNRNKLRILRIAADEFAKKGYEGARVDEIVRRCKVNKNLIYHYFESKDALFLAVLEQAYTRLRERQQSMGLEAGDPIEGIAKLVIDSFKHWGESKNFIAYLNSENLFNAKHIKKSKLIRSTYPALIENIRTLLRRGEEQGVFRSGVDPIDLYISISALGYHFFSNQSTFSVIFGKNFSDRTAIENRLKNVVDVILSYLRFNSRAARRPPPKLHRASRM